MKKLLAAMFVALLMFGCGEEAQKEVVEGEAKEKAAKAKANLEEMETRLKELKVSNTEWHLKYKNAVTKYEIMADENDRLKDEIEKLKKAGSNRDVLPQTVVSKPRVPAEVSAKKTEVKTDKEWIVSLYGLSSAEVRLMLGKPDHISSRGNWVYYRRSLKLPLTSGLTKSLTLCFSSKMKFGRPYYGVDYLSDDGNGVMGWTVDQYSTPMFMNMLNVKYNPATNRNERPIR